MAANDVVRSKRPNAKLLYPKDIGTSISKPGDFDMVYDVEESPPGEIIIVEAKRWVAEKLEIWHIEYTAEITNLMSEKRKGRLKNNSKTNPRCSFIRHTYSIYTYSSKHSRERGCIGCKTKSGRV
ncbi:hypothetical protein R7Z44_24155 [Vibrio sp. 1409]|uniref:hypothetical protein n=1 Tax=Vibrio sp. 1409 TaxID=3074558 RepID=UPI001CF54C89|nr:hypothetical protein [Vibrio alginolyticus]MDW2260774.1 hypothetical protein [Vibrio sp. 1409]